jgi:hypothetical protein
VFDAVEVRVSGRGVPEVLIWRGRRWVVGAEPVRWYERREDWWLTAPRANKGCGLRIDRQIWQLQVRLGRAGELRTVYVEHDEIAGSWRIPYDMGSLERRPA